MFLYLNEIPYVLIQMWPSKSFSSISITFQGKGQGHEILKIGYSSTFNNQARRVDHQSRRGLFSLYD